MFYGIEQSHTIHTHTQTRAHGPQANFLPLQILAQFISAHSLVPRLPSFFRLRFTFAQPKKAGKVGNEAKVPMRLTIPSDFPFTYTLNPCTSVAAPSTSPSPSPPSSLPPPPPSSPCPPLSEDRGGGRGEGDQVRRRHEAEK